MRDSDCSVLELRARVASPESTLRTYKWLICWTLKSATPMRPTTGFSLRQAWCGSRNELVGGFGRPPTRAPLLQIPRQHRETNECSCCSKVKITQDTGATSDNLAHGRCVRTRAFAIPALRASASNSSFLKAACTDTGPSCTEMRCHLKSQRVAGRKWYAMGPRSRSIAKTARRAMVLNLPNSSVTCSFEKWCRNRELKPKS